MKFKLIQALLLSFDILFVIFNQLINKIDGLSGAFPDHRSSSRSLLSDIARDAMMHKDLNSMAPLSQLLLKFLLFLLLSLFFLLVVEDAILDHLDTEFSL